VHFQRVNTLAGLGRGQALEVIQMNPITDFNAREFLTFYPVFILAGGMVRRWFTWQSDRRSMTPGFLRSGQPYDVA
jgi:hypothetical protein